MSRSIIMPMILTYIVTVLATPVDNSARVGSETNSQLDLSPSGATGDRDTKVKVRRRREHRRISAEKCEEYTRDTVWVLPLKKSRPIPISVGCAFATNPLIAGGEVARPGEFPHMAAVGWLLEDGAIGYYCGGSLLSDRWVLTAAHCTHHATMGSPFVVRLGANRLSDANSGELVTIDRIKRHPSYRPPSMYADLALLGLTRAVSFTANLRPACLDSQFDKAPTQAWVTGWGSKELDGESSDVLLKAKLDIVDNVHCSLLHNFTTSVPSGVVPSMLCAGDPDGGWKKDTCQGDSGGPLQAVHPDGCRPYVIIGVTSFGRLCATPDFPGVYTRVSHYLEWIESTVWHEND